jgi:hypothetical protein
MKLPFVAALRSIWPVAWQCSALSVSRSDFHAWLTRPPSQLALAEEKVAPQVRSSFLASDRTYGGDYQAADYGGPVAAPIGSGEQQCFSARSHAPQRAFGSVVDHADTAVIEEPRECGSALQHVVHCARDIIVSRQPAALDVHPLLQPRDQWHDPAAPDADPLLRRHAFDLALEGQDRLRGAVVVQTLSYRRATLDAFEAGCPISARSQSLLSSRQRRRRSMYVMISNPPILSVTPRLRLTVRLVRRLNSGGQAVAERIWLKSGAVVPPTRARQCGYDRYYA